MQGHAHYSSSTFRFNSAQIASPRSGQAEGRRSISPTENRSSGFTHPIQRRMIGVPQEPVGGAAQERRPERRGEFGNDASRGRSYPRRRQPAMCSFTLLIQNPVFHEIRVREPQLCPIRGGQCIVNAVPERDFRCAQTWVTCFRECHIPEVIDRHVEISPISRPISLNSGAGNAPSKLSDNVFDHRPPFMQYRVPRRRHEPAHATMGR